MVDSARHFLPVKTLKKVIDGLMFSKMNIMHWHISDGDSFPLVIPAVPSISEYGKIGGTYSQSDIRDITGYAKSRGVRVIL